VVYEHVTLWTAEQKGLLVDDLSIEVSEGQRLAITGPHSVNEAVLHATAGLWIEGQGRISRPGPGGIMFVAQRPSKASGRLRDILLDHLSRKPKDDELLAMLAKVGLDGVVVREGGLDAEEDWAAALQPAELQALAFARLLLAGPRFAFLDNPDGALESSVRGRLYLALADCSIIYVTAGCPSSLLRYHGRRLEFGDDGSWRVERIGAEPSPPRAGES
jgi:putative ATP-binding cassette transporter